MWNRHENGEVWYTSPLLDDAGVRHLFATRIGGVSEGVFGGWNFAAGIGEVRDSEQNVLANYEIAAGKCSVKNMVTGQQVTVTAGEAAEIIKAAVTADIPVILEK